jgi:hypothetical protein
VDRIAAAILPGFIILSAALNGALAWLGRYEISAIASSAGSGVYVMDRWTGIVVGCTPDRGCHRAYPQDSVAP